MPLPNPRFTIQCLNKLEIPIPKIHEKFISDIEHPFLIQASRLMFRGGEGNLERISSINDNKLFKCKPNIPSRAAIWIDSTKQNCTWWIVDGGKREEGSKKDFYVSLEEKAKRQIKIARKTDSSYKPNKTTCVDYLLPKKEDYTRLILEAQISQLLAQEREIREAYMKSCINLNFPYQTYINDSCIEVTTISDGTINETYVVISSAKIFPKKYIELILNLINPDDYGYTHLRSSGSHIDTDDEICIYMIKVLK